ncbi:MAG: SDR family oxidoreductase [Dehalococcoidales bacterium]|nr:MAG: SDR family oxidoreductase [Dehalococcoidales bacterium]
MITGATSGIGAAYAKRLAADGYDLILTGRRQEIIQKLADELADKHKIKVKVLIVELSDDNDIQKLIDTVTSTDDMEVLINNAGFDPDEKHFMGMEFRDVERMIKVHQIVPVRLAYAVVPKMEKRRKGTIINVSSAGAFLPSPNIVIYGATKSFLKMFSESLYMDLREKGIKVQVLCPGLTRTDFHRGLPEERYQKISSDFHWMTADQVVDYSLKCLKKNNQPICIPGMRNRLYSALIPVLPKAIYYRIALKKAGA